MHQRLGTPDGASAEPFGHNVIGLCTCTGKWEGGLPSVEDLAFISGCRASSCLTLQIALLKGHCPHFTKRRAGTKCHSPEEVKRDPDLAPCFRSLCLGKAASHVSGADSGQLGLHVSWLPHRCPATGAVTRGWCKQRLATWI